MTLSSRFSALPCGQLAKFQVNALTGLYDFAFKLQACFSRSDLIAMRCKMDDNYDRC
jgi:hypothetical protein